MAIVISYFSIGLVLAVINSIPAIEDWHINLMNRFLNRRGKYIEYKVKAEKVENNNTTFLITSWPFVLIGLVLLIRDSFDD